MMMSVSHFFGASVSPSAISSGDMLSHGRNVSSPPPAYELITNAPPPYVEVPLDSGFENPVYFSIESRSMPPPYALQDTQQCSPY